MKNLLFSLLFIVFVVNSFAQNMTIQNNTQSVLITPDAIKTNRPSLTGTSNISIGNQALKANGVFNNNIAIGDSALMSATSASNNIAIGVNAAKNTTTTIGGVGGLNIAIGNNSLMANSLGFYNLALGHNALHLANGSWNTALGLWSQNAANTGTFNTSVGIATLQSLTNGLSNTAIGSNAMSSFNNGNYNTALGMGTLGDGFHNATGDNNVAVGYNSLSSNQSSYNVGMGFQTLQNNTTGYANTAIGANALSANVTGGSNTVIGGFALGANKNGEGNTAIGHGAGLSNEGSYNIFIGRGAGFNEVSSNFKLFIGNSVVFAGTNTLIFGDFLTHQIGINQTNPADQFVIHQPSDALSNFTQWTNPNSGITSGDGFEVGIQNNSDAIIWQNEANPIIFATNNLERLRINAAGTLISTSDRGFSFTSAAASNVTIYNTNTLNSAALDFDSPNGGLRLLGTPNNLIVSSLGEGGSYAAVSASAFNVLSDIRAKKEIVNLDSDNYDEYLGQIRKIQSATYRYNWEDSKSRQTPHIGFIAQTLPAAVVTSMDKTPSSPSEKQLGYNIADMAGLTLMGLKAVDAEIQQLKEIIKELQAEIQVLKKK